MNVGRRDAARAKGVRVCDPQQCSQFQRVDSSSGGSYLSPCCGSQSRAPIFCVAFTLVELLVVIAIIGVLAAMLLPVLAAAKKRAQVVKAKTEISQLANDITSYFTTYDHYPTAQNLGSNDFTYGGGSLGTIMGVGPWNVTNDEVIAILMDIQTNPMTGLGTVNAGHVKNTQQIKFLNATMVGNTNDPGVGQDLVYRDPWGDPYIISMNLKYNENTQDAFYSRHNVSFQSNQAAGINGLINVSDPTGASDDFEYHGGVMVWSVGPDKKADKNLAANQSVNKDNVLSWTP